MQGSSNGQTYLDVSNSANARVDFPEAQIMGGPLSGSRLVLNYVSGGGDVPMALYSNGEYVRDIVFADTGNWNTWTELRVDDPFIPSLITPARNQISLVALRESANGAPHIASASYQFFLNCSGAGCGYSPPVTNSCPEEPYPGSGGNLNPVASFTASQTVGAGIVSVNFDAANSIDPDGDVLTYEWSADQVVFSNNPQASRVFYRGMHEVRLTVRDGRGGEHSAYRLIMVNDESSAGNQRPAIYALFKQQGFAPLAVDFDASDSFDPEGNSLSFLWHINKVEKVFRGPTGSVILDEPGTYLVTLLVSDGVTIGRQQQTIVVRERGDKPKCDMTVVDFGSGMTATVTLSNYGNTDINGWEVWWEYPQPINIVSEFGAPVSGNNPYFADPASYNVVIPAGGWTTFGFSTSRPFGEPAQAIPEIKGTLCDNTEQPPARNHPPIANLSASATSGYAPLTINFSAAGSSDADGDPLNYNWVFGDGTTATGMEVSHTFTEVRGYRVNLTVDDGGESASAFVDVNVLETPDGSTPVELGCNVGTLDIWNSGVVTNLVVQNTTSSDAEGYHGVVKFSHAVSATNMWNAAIVPPSDPTEVHFSSSSLLIPNQQANFGFQGTHSAGSALQLISCEVFAGD